MPNVLQFPTNSGIDCQGKHFIVILCSDGRLNGGHIKKQLEREFNGKALFIRKAGPAYPFFSRKLDSLGERAALLQEILVLVKLHPDVALVVATSHEDCKRLAEHRATSSKEEEVEFEKSAAQVMAHRLGLSLGQINIGAVPATFLLVGRTKKDKPKWGLKVLERMLPEVFLEAEEPEMEQRALAAE